MKKKYRLKPEVKQWLKVAVVSLILLQLFYGAYDSHQNPERFQRCVETGMLFWFE